MKLIAPILFIVVLSASVITKDACRSKNPFLKSLDSKGVTIFEKPQVATDDTCKDIWSKRNTCCDSKSLIAYANKEAAEQHKSLDSINQQFGIYHQMLSSLRSELKFIRNLDMEKWDKDNQLLMDIKSKAGKEITHAQQVAHTLLLRQGLKNFPNKDSVEAFQQANRKCWNKMIKLRQLILCPTCAGNSENYFFEGKAFIMESTCSDIIDECSESLKGMILYLQGISEMNEIFNIEPWTNGLIKIRGEESEYKVETAQSYFTSNFRQHVKEIVISNELKKELSTHTSRLLSRTLCRLVVTVNRETLLQTLASLFQGAGIDVELFEPLQEVKKILNVQESGDAAEEKTDCKLGFTKMSIIMNEDTKENTKVENAIKKCKGNSTPVTFGDSLVNHRREERHSRRSELRNHWQGVFHTYRWRSRRLKDQSDVFSNNLQVFATDILVIKKSDNMFDSFDGNKGTTLDSASTVIQPMNLTTHFP